ncbi:dTMP kinase [Clostridiales bacterium COT073_COT-073]|nr:dTMP kinase [Clostridiales bacterium COT073_COT-073]
MKLKNQQEAAMFIAIEGMDGSGKSTQIELLRQKLTDTHNSVLITREPGGTPIGEKIREILLAPENIKMSVRTEALLYAASRAQHIDEVIEPALAAGKIVITDRYVASSYVYQGIARELGLDPVRKINEFAIRGRMPDLTIFLFVSQEKAIQRKKAQKELDRLEAESMSFHNRVNQGFRDLAESYQYPKVIINTDQDAQSVHREIWLAVTERLNMNKKTQSAGAKISKEAEE